MELNGFIDFVGLVIILLIAWNRRGEKPQKDWQQRLFDHLLLLAGVILVTDILCWNIMGRQFVGARAAHIALNFVYFISQVMYAYIWLVFTMCWAAWPDGRPRRSWVLCAIPMIPETLLLVVNLWTGWIYSVTAANEYARGVWFNLNYAVYYAYIGAAAAVALWGVFNRRNAERRRNCRYLALYMLLPILATALNFRWYGVSLLWPFCALSLLMVYLNVQQRLIVMQTNTIRQQQMDSLRRAESEAKRENELTKSRVAIMRSQIQPHFLFNALSAITALCDLDPGLAKRAVCAFAEYLRGNLDSLSLETPVPFQRERNHTESYLMLEKLRFGENLQVTWDVGVSDFLLPFLSVQPLVENSVRYATAQARGSCAVTIRVRGCEEFIEIFVIDDGAGFNPDNPASDGLPHVGIGNVRQRLASQCGGTLEITSKIDAGTTAVIRIPRERAGKS